MIGTFGQSLPERGEANWAIYPGFLVKLVKEVPKFAKGSPKSIIKKKLFAMFFI